MVRIKRTTGFCLANDTKKAYDKSENKAFNRDEGGWVCCFKRQEGRYLVYQDEKGNKIVKKKLESLDGTITNYNYTEDKKGNRKINYTITDNTGKELYKLDSTFEVIDENTLGEDDNG